MAADRRRAFRFAMEFNQSWLAIGAGFEALRTGGTPDEFDSVCRTLR
jgi:hypothetical protein